MREKHKTLTSANTYFLRKTYLEPISHIEHMQKGPYFLVDIRGLMGKVAEWIENRCMLIRSSVLKYAIGYFELI